MGTPDGKFSMVTTWIPIVPVTIDNGCMYVVKMNQDPLFALAEDPLHMKPDRDLAISQGHPLLCDAGDVLMWRSSLIHWGSGCAPGVVKPRKSISTLFMHRQP